MPSTLFWLLCSEELTMLNWLERARKRGCPLLAVSTPEPLGTVQAMREWLCQQDGIGWQWDCAAGLAPLTRAAEEYGCEEHTENPDRALKWALSMPSSSLLVAQWHGEFWQDVLVRQAVRNLRDQFKANKRTLVLVGCQIAVPTGLRNDFLVWEDTLPGTCELDAVVNMIEQTTGIAPLGEQDHARAVDALRGMTAFEAEQHCAMAAQKCGIDVAALWQAKVTLVNDTPGLQCWLGGETEQDIRGLGALRADFHAMQAGRLPVRLVVWVDESEDMLAGVEGDTSGVSQDYLGTLAKHLQDTEAQSILLAGHPGTGKSLSAKIACSIFGCLGLALDLGACKSSLVGESERNLRHALQIEQAIAGHQRGQVLYVWTTNNAEALPHKLRARMQGEYFCDLPGEQEGLAIWSLYRNKYEIAPGDAYPAKCEGWTGREIARCCRLAWQFRVGLQEASCRIVPIKISQAASIAERRKNASGRYLDASAGGVYRWQERTEGRAVSL